MYYDMLRIRLIEERIAEAYAEQEMRAPVHLSIGQEGVAVGTCAAIKTSDYIMSTHRAHAHYLAKGGDLPRMMAEIYGKKTGCCGGRGGSMHLVDLEIGMMGCTPIVGGTMPVAVGLAFGNVLQQKDNLTVIYFGEGSTEEGVFYESLNFAAVKNLPILFICENNLYSVYSPLEVRQPKKRNLVELARAMGITADSGDGNKVDEVYGLTHSYVNQMRAGLGPVLLEFSTYRWREHCGPNYDNDIGYRNESEFLSWKEKCPLAYFENKLRTAKQLTDAIKNQFEKEIKAEIAEAIKFAKTSDFAEASSMSQFVYAEEIN